MQSVELAYEDGPKKIKFTMNHEQLHIRQICVTIYKLALLYTPKNP